MLDFHALSVGLDVVFGIAAAVFAALARTNARVKAVAIAIAAAEKAVDKTMYNDDGSFNEAREAFALAVLDHILPHVPPADIKADLDEVLAIVHKHAHDEDNLQ
jgi:protein-tyrosine phosphatase